MQIDEFAFRECYPINAGDFASAGEASGRIKKILKQIGIDSSIVRKASIAAYEAELNLVIHSFGGELMFEINTSQIKIIASDNGPGIRDIDLAMQEGFSTASETVRQMGFGAGMGLPNMKRCADEFTIDSQLDKGTIVTIKINLG